MPKVSIKLPTELYRELQSAAASMQEPGYSAVNFITDVLTSDLASRRLPRMALGRLGGRVTVAKDNSEPVSHRLCLPQLVS
jgi:metal-responsive CopG/Arc/MetJ family transcriptional regulator